MRIIVLLFLPLLFIGCSQSPPELKKLRSVTITVTDNGKPLEGVLVALANKSPQTPRGCSGLTSASGIARIATSLGSHSVLGAAPGEYKVVLEKAVEFPLELQSSDEELLPKKERQVRSAKREAFLSKNRVVPVKFESRSASPIDLTVSETCSTELTIDISKY